MAAPKPPKIRPRPASNASQGTSAKPIQPVIRKITDRPRSFSTAMPGEAAQALNLPARSTETRKVGFVARPMPAGRQVFQSNSNRAFQNRDGRDGSTRHGGGGSRSSGGRRSGRMGDPLKNAASALNDRKFLPKQGALTGHELHAEEGKGPGLKRNTLYYVPLGGLDEIGRNCMFFEYNDEIVVIDMGIQFPEEETPGVDWIIPNINYLEKKRKNIKALIITHAHYDHFGAVPYVLEKLGNPVIYGSPLIKAVIEKRLSEMPNAPKMRFIPIKNHDRVKISEHMTAEFFNVSHTVPDTTGLVLETPIGNMVHFADFRVEYTRDGAPDLREFEWLGKKGVHTLLIDSTNADEHGHSVSEDVVVENLEKLLKEAEGRIILSTFASMITRLAEVINIAERIGRKVAINGRSMKDNLEIAKTLGYLKYKPDSVIPVEEIQKYPDHKLLILSTGAMGQENAGLMRIVTGEHKYIRIKPGDTVIFSSSVIPGSERGVQTLKDNFSRQGAIVHTNQDLDIHASGHAPGDDLGMISAICKPKFVIPIHGHFFKRAANVQNMKKVGIAKEQVILLDNGVVTEITKDNVKATTKMVDSYYVMVDGLGVGDVEAVVIRDRKLLSQEGMVVIIVSVNRRDGRLLKNPDVISRGFIYLKDHTTLIEEIRGKLRIIVGQVAHSQKTDPDYLKELIRNQIGQFLYTKTQRRPMILPVIIEV
ncbi:MAG: ribonuclease J [bacterium]|nr:ribonuclease J [bacterium]